MCDTSALDELAASVVVEDTAPVAAVGWRSAEAAGGVGGATEALFDLASVSKSFTAVAVALSDLDRATKLAELLPELADAPAGHATLEQLLSHRAGLVAHLELFAPLRDRGEGIEPARARKTAASARRPECVGPIPDGGFDAVYSDLGYLLAGEALARHVGVVDAGAAVERLIVTPLGLERRLGTARALGPHADYVATETTSWRSVSPLRGVVHDENAFVLTGLGGSGHAGLFGTVGAVLEFGVAVLELLEGKGPLADAALPSEPPGWLVEPRPRTTWRAGFDGKSHAGSSAGALASSRSFGHLGFTGTSLWIDPERALVTSLLCNRVAPSRHRTPAAGGIKVTRPRVHEALFRLAGWGTVRP